MIFERKLDAFWKGHELKYNFNESDCSPAAAKVSKNLSQEMDKAAEDHTIPYKYIALILMWQSTLSWQVIHCSLTPGWLCVLFAL